MTDISAAGIELTAEPPPAPDVQVAQATPRVNEYLELVKTPATPEAPAQPANPYVDVLRRDDADRATRMRATALSTQGSSPATAAEAVALARKTGMPADMVERNLPEVATQQKANEYADLLKRAPKMADWLAQDPINAKVMAQDDVERLGFVEWTVNELYRPYLTQQASSNLAGVKAATRKTVELEAALGRQARGEYLTPFDKAMIAQEPEIRDAMRGYIIQYGSQREEKLQAAAALPELPVIKDMQKAGEAGDWGGVFSALMKDPVRAAYVIALQGSAMLPWQIGGYAVGGATGVFGVSFGLEYMGAVEDALKQSGVNTQDPTQIVAAFGNPELMAKIERQAATKASVIGALDAVSMRMARVPLGVGKSAVTRTATDIGAQIGVQGALGGAGEALGSVAAGMKVDPFAVISEVIGEMGTGPAEVAGARWGQAVRQDATREQWEKFQALPPLEQYATGQTMLLDKLVAQANDTKLATTSPEKLQEFIAGVSAQDATVFVPAEAMQTYMQDMTGLQAEAFLGKLGITAGELARIRQTDEDFAIPLAMYITGASEAHAAWRQQIRTEVDGFSVKQAQEWEKAKASELKALQDKFEEHVQSGLAPDPQGVVYQQVLEMAKANGYTNEAAAQHAALYAARYAARAARNPAQFADALDAFEKAGPGTGMRIQTMLADGTRVMGPDVLDTMLDSLRSGKEPAKPPKFKGPKIPKQTAAERTAAAALVFKQNRSQLGRVLDSLGLDIAKMSNAQIRAAIQKEIKGQTLHQESRGSITFGDNATIIQLFQARDLSTLAHESGHLWLSELEFDVKNVGAGEQARADWQTVLDFVGSKDGYITREQHELFARAFETYLMEGKAPSEGLRSVFRQFRNWLVSIYRNLANLQAPISPEMRQVFDRLLATDEEIAAAKNTQGLNPVFVDAKSAGMTDTEFQAYTRRATQVVDEAEQAVLDKVMASIRKERTKEVAAEKAKIRGEVTDELMAEPGQAALHLLRKGKLYAGETPEVLAGAKLARNALVEMLGEAGLANLPAGIHAAEGVDPDVLAQAVGLGNGVELVERLMQIEAEQRAMRAKGDNRSMLAARIAEETQKRLTESLGDPLNDGSIEAEAMAAVHSDKQGALMSTELKVLARKAKQPGAITLSDIETWAANTIAEMSVYQGTQHAKYQRAERMAGQKVQRALIKGDFVAAFKAKQDQLVNFALYREAKKAADDVDGIRKLADRYASAETIKSMDQGSLEQIHQLLEAYDFKKRSGTLLAERTTFAMWAAEQAAAGFEVMEPPRLAGGKHYSQMTLEEIRGVGDTIKQMAHIGRWKQSMIDDGKRRDFEALVDEAVETIGRQPQRGVSQLRRGTTRLQDVLGDVGSWFRSVDAALLKMETLFEWLDGDKKGQGVFGRYFRRVADAQVQERDLQKRLVADAKAIYDKVPAEQSKLWSQQHVVEDLGAKLNKSQMIAVALNMGNASNMQKMLQGEDWAEAPVRAILDKHLTKEEWQFVQDTWDLIESLWPQTEAMEKRINGVAPPKVEAVPVETRFGTLRGGYYPMAYDRAGDVKADRIAAMGSEGLFDPEYRRASTRAGSTHKRVEGFNAKVLLSLNVIGSHLNEVAHDLAFREVVMDGYKFLSNDKVREAIRSAIGPEYEKQTLVWLKAVANEWAIDRRGLEGVDKFLQTARANTAIVGMGFRVSTMLSQTAGFSNSVQRLGSANMLRGLRDFYRNPFAMKEAVHEKSGEMRNRANDLERDIRLALQRMEGKDTTLANVRRFAFRGIALFDAAVSLPTWMGAYNKGLREGMTEKEAVAYGDKMVRDTQGAGSVKDLSAFQRGSEPLKLLGMFYSYFNVYYNRQRGLVRDLRSADSFSDYMDVVAQGMWLMVVPTLLAALLSGQGPDDDEEWWIWAARNVGFGVFSGLPWARDIAGAASNEIAGKNFGGAKLSPVQGIGEGTLKLFKDAAKLVEGKETSKTSIKNTFNVAGLFTGLPLGQVGASTQFVWDALVEETQDPEGLLDWLKGLAYGPKPKK